MFRAAMASPEAEVSTNAPSTSTAGPASLLVLLTVTSSGSTPLKVASPLVAAAVMMV